MTNTVGVAGVSATVMMAILTPFAKAGTYPYFCSLHPKMTGTVVVQ